ncbi:hypothetical protein [Phocaeicola vulgatus]|uniref:hypothetical protein n=1 Tax=Phocaeicola vulgatus TaxID=821 RepID=UPI0022E08C26|nr:hypothetical protein [Phocaeicola vulgatus]
MRIVLTDKPVMARSIASVLGANEKAEGYLTATGMPSHELTATCWHRHRRPLTGPPVWNGRRFPSFRSRSASLSDKSGRRKGMSPTR